MAINKHHFTVKFWFIGKIQKRMNMHELNEY